VTVENTGDTDLTGVCATMEDINFTGDRCVDIPVGERHNFTLNVVPVQNVTYARVIVSDSENLTSDEVGIRVLKLEITIPEEEPEENVTVPIIAPPPSPPVEEKTIERPFEYLLVILVIVLMVLIGLVVKLMEKKPQKKKMRPQKLSSAKK
jgi:hypothetical protein